MGGCDFIEVPKTDKTETNVLQKYSAIMAFGVPFFIIFVSYTIIWVKVTKKK